MTNITKTLVQRLERLEALRFDAYSGSDMMTWTNEQLAALAGTVVPKIDMSRLTDDELRAIIHRG